MNGLELKKGMDIITVSLMITLSLLSLLNGGFDNEVVYWVLLALLAVSGWLLITGRSLFNIAFDTPLLWYALFVFWGGMSIFWSLNPHRTLVEFLQLVCYALIILLSMQLQKDNFVKVGRMLLITGIGIAAFGIGEYLFVENGRIASTFFNPNALGIFLVLVFCFSWGYYLRRPNRILFAACLILFTSLLLTGSRGSLLSLILAAPFMLLGLKGRLRLTAIKQTLICILLAILLTQSIMEVATYLPKNKGIDKFLSQILLRSGSFLPSSVEGRWNFWQVGGRLFESNPIHGYGLGTFYLAYYQEYAGNRWYARFAHNHYLQTAAELGIVGVLLFGGFLLTLFLRIRKKMKQGCLPDYFPGILVGLTAFLLHIGIDFSWNFPGVTGIFFAMAGVAVTETNYKHRSALKLSPRFGLVVLPLLVILTGWKLSSGILYAKGVQAASQANLVTSTRYYETANSFYPINPMGYYFVSKNYINKYKETKDRELLKKALASAQKAVNLSPSDGMLQNWLGKLYWAQGKQWEAEKHLLIGAKYGAYILQRYLDLGEFYLQANRISEAKSVLLQGLALKKAALQSARSEEDKEIAENNAIKIHLYLANIYFKDNKKESALNQIQLAKKLKPENPILQQYINRQ